MPNSPGIVCGTPGCGGVRHAGICDRGCNVGAKGGRKREDNRKGSTARGYDYQWQQFRERYLREHPLCVDCENEGVVSSARDIHHKQKLRDRPELKYEDSNLLALCGVCHAKRTARGE